MTPNADLAPLLKALKLSPMLDTLPERIALARRDQLDYASFLEIILTDEVSRREHRRIENRLNRAGFEETSRLEDFDWTAKITLDRRLLDAAFSLDFIAKHEHVLLMGPAGVGKSFMAQALGYTAARAGYSVRFIHADDYFKAMSQARADNSMDKTFRSFLTPDLLILDDLGLHRLTAQQWMTFTIWSSASTGPPASSSPPTGPSKSGSASSTIPSWATAPWTASPTPATRSSSKEPATGRGSPLTAPYSARWPRA